MAGRLVEKDGRWLKASAVILPSKSPGVMPKKGSDQCSVINEQWSLNE